MSDSGIRAIAFYLPQYHPIPENDGWWGKGFTEWTNVTKARPLFKGHEQPRLPADLGFYDLRIPEVREAQAKMAAEYGIEGFCYWHYWFGDGRKLLERPITEVIESRNPDFPFCLAWANETWSGIWHGNPDQVLMEQRYPGEQDYINYFNDLLKAFNDDRYIRVEGKPMFVINAPDQIPDIVSFTNLFRKLASQNELPGLYIVANTSREDWDPIVHGCDAVNLVLVGSLYRGLPPTKNVFYRKYKNQLIKSAWLTRLYRRVRKRPLQIYKYADVIPFLTSKKKFNYDCYPCIIPNWDNSARSGINSMILHKSSPQLFEEHLKDAIEIIAKNAPEKRIIFIKSWNEWAEGNYLEPDRTHGYDYLDVLKKTLQSKVEK
ncbi:MAG: lipopolysaccharide biosynthesis protein [Chryseobacterium sp.]|nr:MAG: lipopolysaccharide biosynthesis protein [Chryseobacterium sp.]